MQKLQISIEKVTQLFFYIYNNIYFLLFIVYLQCKYFILQFKI